MSRYDSKTVKAEIPRGKWKRQTNPATGRPYIYIRCGRCDGALMLRVHTVNNEGVIKPSIGCGWCGWHAWGTLADFDEDPITEPAQ